MGKFSKAQLKLFLRFFKFLLPYRRKWLLILILSGAGTLLGLINPYLTKLVIDRAIANKNLKLFISLVLIGGSIFVLIGLIKGFKEYLDRYIKLKVKFDLNKKVFRHIEGLSFSWFQNKSTGEHLYKIGYDIERVKDFITTTPPQAIALFPKLIFILAIVFYLNWKMALFSLCLAPFLYLPPFYFARKMRKVWRALIENSEGIFKSLEEVFSHIQLVKVFGKEAASIRDYLRKLIANIRVSVRNIKLGIFSDFAGSTLNRVIIGLITFYGGYQVIKGQMTLGSLAAIMVYLSQLIGLEWSFARFFQTTALGLVSCQRIARVLDTKTRVVEVKGAEKVEFGKGEVLFKEVSFGFEGQGSILNRINLDIKGGGHVALVGPSGCGKTTMLNLILRLYDPWQGEIIIDGYNIRDLKLSSLREQIGMALQEPFLLNDTVERNITYGVDRIDKKEIVEISKICGVAEVVVSLPERYQTIIGENACKISEGQKQKIAIARALLKKPRILILDEAFSSMDSASEEIIIRNIRKAVGSITLIVVSHRLSAVMSADLVYFLKRPDKVIINSAQSLLKNDQEFSELFAGQPAS